MGASFCDRFFDCGFIYVRRGDDGEHDGLRMTVMTNTIHRLKSEKKNPMVNIYIHLSIKKKSFSMMSCLGHYCYCIPSYHIISYPNMLFGQIVMHAAQ